MSEYEQIHQARFKYLTRLISSQNLPQSASILDVGCYPPVMYRWLAKNFSQVWGICSPHEKIVNRRIKQTNIDTGPLPFKNDSFNLILCSEVIEHLLGHPKHLLHECVRILKPGGLLLITTPNGICLKRRLALLAGQPPGASLDQLPDMKSSPETVYHIHHKEYTQGELRQIIAGTNNLDLRQLKLVSFYTPARQRVKRQPPATQAVKWLFYLIELFLPPLRDSLVLLVTKR